MNAADRILTALNAAVGRSPTSAYVSIGEALRLFYSRPPQLAIEAHVAAEKFAFVAEFGAQPVQLHGDDFDQLRGDAEWLEQWAGEIRGTCDDVQDARDAEWTEADHHAAYREGLCDAAREASE